MIVQNAEPVKLEAVICPVCGEVLGHFEDLYRRRWGGGVCGCSRCVQAVGADDWAMDEQEAAG